jgi:hypothetical protein
MNVRTLVIALVLLVNGLLLGQAYAAPAGEAKDAVMKVAKAYGIEQWDQIERLDFTFKVKLPNKDETVSRQWTWWPKQSKVTLHREGQDNVTYSRDEIGEDVAKELPQTDKHFINDHYWLLFPFQPVWSNPKVTDEGKAKLPIEEGQAQKLAVRYPSEGGYTPGDGYNLYVNQQGLLQQWQYLPGG